MFYYMLCHSVSVVAFDCAYIKWNYAFIISHGIKNVLEPLCWNFIWSYIERNKWLIIFNNFHQYLHTYISNIILLKIQLWNLIKLYILSQLLNKVIAEDHFVQIAFAIEANIIDRISKSHELNRVHFYMQIITLCFEKLG